MPVSLRHLLDEPLDEVPGLSPAGARVDRMMSLAGRDRAPEVLYDEWWVLPPSDVARLLTEAWDMVELPFVALDPWHWQEMFQACGFIRDGLQAPRRRPRKPILAYRGGAAAEVTDDRPIGACWASRRSVAEWFARRVASAGYPAQVWRARLDPRSLVMVHECRDGGTEYVVGPTALESRGDRYLDVVADYRGNADADR